MDHRKYTLIVIIFLIFIDIPNVKSIDYSSNELFLIVYSDGYVDVNYGVIVEASVARVNIPLFGSNFENIIVINQEKKPLDYVLNGTNIIVDTLGSNNILISYSTPSLTNKVGSLWSLYINSPVIMGILLPETSTIMGMTQIPLGLTMLDDCPYVTMPSGLNEIDYVLGAVGTREHALAVIKNAETTIQAIKIKGINVTYAETILNQAELEFNAGNYIQAEQLANQAKNEAMTIENQANTATNTINLANESIQKAESEGRLSNINSAKEAFQKATEKYNIGDYSNSITYANEANDLAISSKKDDYFQFIMYGIIILVVILIIIYYYKYKSKTQIITPKKTEKKDINVEIIFSKNPDLRMDDKEVIRFIATSGGEVFANEIRDRFEIPRTSAWRMIRRLISLGIVEEKKIGGQSLIKITEKFRKENNS